MSLDQSSPGAAVIGPSSARVNPLLDQKLIVPTSRGSVTARERLYRMLDDAADRPVTTLLAPAGWGKTTLLASWLQQRSEPVAWLSIEPSDSDPIRFWSYVVAALSRSLELSDDHPLATLSPTRATVVDSRFVAELIGVIAGLPQRVSLILDDLHELDEPVIGSALGYLASRMPPNLRVVLSGRYLPGIALGRLRVQGDVSDIRPHDLAFTEAEMRSVLHSSLPDASEVDLQRLIERTEGWPAGVRLAELSIDVGAKGKGGDIAALTGREPLVVEYLLSEVYERQSTDVQQFLLSTCVVGSLTAELANALSGRTDATEMLAAMAETNSFVEIQGRLPWYRYHQLFAETLRHTLARERPEQVAQQHRIAGRWHAVNGNPIEAVRHAAYAEDWPTARDAMFQVWLGMLLDGEAASLARLFDLIPGPVLNADPTLLLMRADYQIEVGDVRAAREDAAAAATMMPALDPADAAIAGTLEALVRLKLAQLAVDVEAARAAAIELLDPPSEFSPPALRAVALLTLAVCEYFSGERVSAERHLRNGLGLARASGHDYLELGFLSQLAVVLTAQDRPRAAVVPAKEAVAIAERRGWLATPRMAEAWQALGWAHFLWGRLDDSDRYLDRAELAARREDPTAIGSAHMVQALVQRQRGNSEAADAMVALANADLDAIADRYVFRSYLIADHARGQIAAGNPPDAEWFATALDVRCGQHSPCAELLAVRAEYLRSQGESEQAREVLEPIRLGQSHGYLDQIMRGWVLIAVLAHERGERAEAVDAMLRAVELGGPQGVIQPFLAYAPSALEVAAHLTSTRPEHAQILAELQSAAPQRGADSLPPESTGLLSDREIDVLQYLAQMLTAAEIGAELFVSVNTVKSHLKNIYRKLDVTNRRQALLRAAELGVIAPIAPR